MSDEDQTADLTLNVPGDSAGGAGAGGDTANDTPEMAQMKLQMAQMRGLLETMQEQLKSGATVPHVPEVVKQPRLIGADWSSMTSAEAHAQGCTQTVLCRDGYYVPASRS